MRLNNQQVYISIYFEKYLTRSTSITWSAVDYLKNKRFKIGSKLCSFLAFLSSFCYRQGQSDALSNKSEQVLVFFKEHRSVTVCRNSISSHFFLKERYLSRRRGTLVSTLQSILFFLFILLSPYLASAQINFQEAAAAKNINHRIEKGGIGAGVSVYDFNQDGLDDLTLATEKGQLIGFYINTGIAFEKIPALVNNREEVKQILWADYDNDGDADLFMTSFHGQNYLYQNIGDLTLVDVTQSSGFSLEKHATYGACWGDYNRDGWLDLLYNVHNYNGDQTGGNHLYQNNADGTFTEVTEIAAMGNENRVPFASTFLDYNNDQWPDIYTANDKLTANTLYENLGNGRFYDASADTKSNARMNAMCVNAADINQDGWVDIYVTNTFVGGQLLENSGPTFYENIDKTHFEIITDGFEQDTFSSFSNAIGDFDADGLLDILVQNNDPAPFHLWDNQTDNNNNWIKIKLAGVLSNRDAIGTRIETYAGDLYQSNFTYCGFGFLGQNTDKHHIGLGQHTQVDSILITWPSGHIDRLYQLLPNQLYKITEGASTNNQITVAADVTIIPRQMITSIETIKPKISLQIAPNPATAYLQIQANFKITNLTILSLTGQTIQQFSVNPTTSTKLTIPSLTSGLYLLKAQDDKGNYLIQKWVKTT